LKNCLIILTLFIFISYNCYGCAPLLIAGGAAAGAVGTHIYKEKYRECPYCKKNIKKDASVCPHCQKEVKPIKKE
jgi:DNA-directed RNA polymerase subunit RPC12/RpoP